MPSNPGLTQGIRRAIQVRGEGTAIIDGDVRISWTGFADRVARLAAAFRAKGLTPGGRVVLLALNSHHSITCFFAAMHAGGVIVPLNHRLSLDELTAQTADCTPDLIVLGPDFADLAVPLATVAHSVKAVLMTAQASAEDRGELLDDLIAAHEPMPDACRGADDLACLFYTSGTTNAAKGVMLSHANILANTANVVAPLGLDENSVHLHHGPLFHVAAGVRLFSVTHVAGTHVFLPRFVAGELIREIDRTGITHATFVPTMLRSMLDDPAMADANLSSLKTISYGSAAMPEPLLREVMTRLPSVRFMQSYGMTELSPVATILSWEDHLPDRWDSGVLRSAGKAAMFCDVRVVGADGAPVPNGTPGEVLVCGPNVMLGYWNRLDLSVEAMRDGWMRTGDIGVLRDDGYLFIVDRLKDMIITGGENVYSQEVENAIAAHPAVSQVAVFGRPDDHWGEAVHATITLKPGTSATAADIIAFTRDRIAHYKCPRSLDIREEPMPLSGANKILKSKLREELLARHAATG